jgi:hypothetical protein
MHKNEHIGNDFRTETTVFPSIAIRELIANALIHQDMTISGAGLSWHLARLLNQLVTGIPQISVQHLSNIHP